jgi:hypothetical protein
LNVMYGGGWWRSVRNAFKKVKKYAKPIGTVAKHVAAATGNPHIAATLGALGMGRSGGSSGSGYSGGSSRFY